MKSSSLFSCFLPPLVLVAFFGLLALANFDYEWKFFQAVTVDGRVEKWLGAKMLLAAAVCGVVSGIFFLVMRRNIADQNPGDRTVIDWLHVVLPGIVSLALWMAGLFVIILGPAALTMLEQMSNPP